MGKTLEERVTELEAKLARYEALIAGFTAGEGGKLARMFGLKLPEAPR